MGISKLWGKDSSGNRGFVFSHIKTIYYNWAQKKLLSTKLDEMDSATNGKIDKTSIVQVESTSQTNVPSSAYLKTVKDSLDGDISELNAKSIRNAVRYDNGDLASYWRGITNLLNGNNEITVAYAVPDKKLSIIYSDENGILRTAKFTPDSDSPMNP